MIVYNQAPFVADAIEGALAQRDDDFSFEIVVGDDGSSDETLAICRRYELRHPGRLRIFASDVNRGMMRNALDVLAACRGRYIAICEGDDYWIDRRKLQLQYHHLEGHPSHALCFHGALIEHPDGHQEVWRPQRVSAVYEFADLFNEWLIPTASVLFRNPGPSAYPPYLAHATHGDLALFGFLADRGRIGYLDRIMSVYRRHPGGVMTSFTGVEFARRQRAFLLEMDVWLEGRHRRQIAKRVGGLCRYAAKKLARAGRRREAVGELRQALLYWRRPDWETLRDLVRIAGLLLTPRCGRDDTGAWDGSGPPSGGHIRTPGR